MNINIDDSDTFIRPTTAVAGYGFKKYDENTHYTVANVPAGLSVLLYSYHSAPYRKIILRFDGNATAHAKANSVNNVTITLKSAILQNGSDLSAVPSKTKNDIKISFNIFYAIRSASRGIGKEGAFVENHNGAAAGDKQKKDLKTIQPIVDKIRSFEKELVTISNDALREITANFKKQIEAVVAPFQKEINEIRSKIKAADTAEKTNYYDRITQIEDDKYNATEAVLQEILPKAFAVVKETAKRFTAPELKVTATPIDRNLSGKKSYVVLKGGDAIWKNHWNAAGTDVVWNMVHYDVQMIGGAVLHNGKIAEMMTGEGKTLVATLPIYLNALTGNGVHVVTVNDYLAKRDAAWMAPIWEFHGLTVDCIDFYEPNSPERKSAYRADITYGTNNEFGFDYLRDNMANHPEDLVQRSPNYAIVDEVDSVLIDDARTPLIISGAVQRDNKEDFENLRPKIADLVKIQQKQLIATLAEARKLIAENKKEGADKLLQIYRGMPKNKALIKFLSTEGVKQLLQKTENFYMADNNKEMPKIDKNLYYVIEEKNNQIDLTDKGIEHLSKGATDEGFFVLPDISLQIGEIDQNTEWDETRKIKEKENCYRDFSIKSERIHTLNQLLKAYTLFEKDKEYVVIDSQVKIVDEQTGRIMEGRRYSDGLHQAIEAKEQVKIEAATQTFATITLQNYFRMYRKLSGMTGTAITESREFWEIYKLDVVEIPTNKPLARIDKEDLVYKTAREKYNAVIEEIQRLVKQNRPVLVGTTSVDISELLSKMLSLRKIKHNVLNAKLHKREADIVADAGKPGMVTIATNMAGRGTDIKLTDEVKKSGGLAIIGTERHDSRRVDRQLRGRSGRQGDVGSSQFYVSLEDHLMRIFGSERIAKLMDRMGLKEGEVIQHRMISKSIERAQKKVEENNFGLRKRLLEYDDIMNAQREIIYKLRKHALDGEKLQLDLYNMMYEICERLVNDYKSTNDYQSFEYSFLMTFSFSSPFMEKLKSISAQKITEQKITSEMYDAVKKAYAERMQRNATLTFPVIKNVYKNEPQYERIVVPFTDGTKVLQVVTHLENAYKTECKSLVQDFEKNISLAMIDEAWKDHLRKMDDLKQSAQNASYEQKDPLLIYKFEAFELFKELIAHIHQEVISFLFKGILPEENNNANISKAQRRSQQKLQLQKDNFEEMMAGGAENKPVETIVRDKPKVGRNEIVTIQNMLSGETKTLKYKKALPLTQNEQWVFV
uniref:Protein translocase subunit SecA n=2 Tax=Eukaryota TaxID=2759 RepID=A0A2B4RLQ7_STYPI